MLKKIQLVTFMVLSMSIHSSCTSTSLAKIRKSSLLDATMDPAKSYPASHAGLMMPSGLWEKADLGNGTNGVGQSCPTCG